MKKLILSIIFAGYALINAQAASCNQQSCNQRDSWSVQAPCKENNWYIQANGSLGWHNDSKFSYNKDRLSERQKPGFGGSVAVGRIIENWRLELEASYRENSSKSKLTTSNTSLMLNGYCDMPVMEDLSFYIGAGAGISSVNGKVHRVEFENTSAEFPKDKNNLDTVFAWQLMSGFSYALSDEWDLILGYRLFATAKPTLAKFHNEKLKMTKMPLSNNVELGLRFKF